jgi:hypothetical protein
MLGKLEKIIMENLKSLISHAVGQFGYDRTYCTTFSASGPIISVREDIDTTELLAQFWMSNDVIQQKNFY